ncbi:hypothetical protein FPZ24_04870 [Sphingomonas panacisoli]|uniref:Uncharacterized protein n=1 Tax=Sphingomonas panacisoli TaxID=1813879 RepID=A0A5B8LH13_9SPHN|nr:hypothetical protein [Sphingomonas panacisoli]QDZ06892.1 hypothetical protein FPZ24_04870 [Sphingomonas panacisoli]
MSEAANTDTTAAAADTSNGKTGLADALREHFSGDAPITEKIQNFAKARPWASGMLVGVAGLLLAGTLRGKRR